MAITFLPCGRSAVALRTISSQCAAYSNAAAALVSYQYFLMVYTESLVCVLLICRAHAAHRKPTVTLPLQLRTPMPTRQLASQPSRSPLILGTSQPVHSSRPQRPQRGRDPPRPGPAPAARVSRV